MTDRKFIVKQLGSRDYQEKIFRAYARAEGGDLFHPLSFSGKQIDSVIGVTENSSAIVMTSGIKIVVALPYLELEDKIYAGYDQIVDLRSVTGDVAKEIIAPHLSHDFDVAAKKPLSERGLKFNALLRRRDSNQFVACEFYEADVKLFEPEDTDRSKSGTAVKIHFNNKAGYYGGPFCDGYALLDMSASDFKYYLNQAKMSGSGELDLVRVFSSYPHQYGSKV